MHDVAERSEAHDQEAHNCRDWTLERLVLAGATTQIATGILISNTNL
jgi:hypothetical protein